VVERAMQVLDRLSKHGSPPGRGRRRSVTRAMAGPTEQLALFEPADHPFVDQLRDLDIARMTPLDALTLLHRWQELLHDRESTDS